MTRGKIILITEDKIMSSIEFNGSMYPEDEGYGQEIIAALEKINTISEHKKFVKHFNKAHHRYKDKELVYDCDETDYDEEELLDLMDDYFGKWFSDYLYIKNARASDVEINTRDCKSVTIKTGGICVLNFGCLDDDCLAISKDIKVSASQKLIDLCESLGWWMNFYETEIEIGKSSPMGEDFFFTVSRENFAEDIEKYADDFDPDEHAEMWVEFRGTRGVPTSIRDLIDDADAIDKMLSELSEAIKNYSITRRY